jgi:putative hemolysin
MIPLFFLLLFSSFILAIFCSSLKTFIPFKIDNAQKILKSYSVYTSFHRVFLKTDELQTILIAASVSKFIFLFFTFFVGFKISTTPIDLIFLFLVSWIFCEFIPAVLGFRYPEKILTFSATVSSLLLLSTFLFNFIILKFPKKILKSLFERDSPEIHLQEALENIKSKSMPDPHNKKLIEALLSFKDRKSREVMIPRINVFALPISLNLLQATDAILNEGFSRIPIYKDSIDTIIGIVLYKDILKIFQKIQKNELPSSYLESSIEILLKPVLYTPETKKVSQLLQDFKVKQMHLAIVVDEYGCTEGIVTIEDIIEEIVGDIADEYDVTEDNLYTTAPKGGWIVDAKMSILDVYENFSIKIPVEGDFDTIGGFIFQRSGIIPKKGFRIYLDDFDIEVLSATDRSIEKVKLTLNPKTKEKNLASYS